MIIWITGAAAVGKSTVTQLIKDKLLYHYSNLHYSGHDHEYTSKNGFKIPFSTYGGKVMVVGRKGEGVLRGTDGVTRGIGRFKDFLHYEYFKWKPTFTPQIIVEGHKFISKPEMHDFLIKENIKYKMYCLKVSRDEMDERSKKRGNGWDTKTRTPKVIDNQLEEYNIVISKYKNNNNIEIRTSETKEQQENIADEIIKDLKF